ncbi:MAG: hypothetical protein LUM44_04495 [Pyrinomonadaceae bacterium]|nr:hypothetical protein [Pyrinomonadaceae bacterium]
MNYFLIITALILAAISLGIIIFFILIYSAWVNDESYGIAILETDAAPLILVILAVVEVVISLILFSIVRRFRK